jgi:hypothetical protein
MNDRLEKELEEILRGKGADKAPGETGEKFAPCVNHTSVPPLGCILGYDPQCDFCSHYEGIKRKDK